MATAGRAVKEQMVTEVSNRLKERPTFIVTNVGRLPGSKTDALRKQLRMADARLLVLSHRLGLRSLEPLKLGDLEPLFEGSVGLVLPSDDLAPTAKVIVEFIKANQDLLVIRGALLDGQVLDAKRVEQLASLPPKPVLRAHVLAAIEGPLAQLISVVEQLIGDVAWVTEQAAAKAPKPAAAPGPPEAPQAGAAETPAAPGTSDATQEQGGSG
jgi:large subunit ribosomal protein L10